MGFIIIARKNWLFKRKMERGAVNKRLHLMLSDGTLGFRHDLEVGFLYSHIIIIAN